MTATVNQLGYLGIETSVPDEWSRFAAEVLGLEVTQPGVDDTILLRMDENHHRIAVHSGTSDDVAYVGWVCRDESALGQIADRLESAGVGVTRGTSDEAEARQVEGLIKATDPNGVVNEIHHGPLAEPGRPFESPRGLAGFQAGDMGFGHIVLNVDDYEASLRFYRDGLGLLISDYIELDIGAPDPLTIAFLHCGPRHHSVALVEYPAEKRLHHVMLELTDMNDVGTTYDLCHDRGVPIISSLGRHTNDKMTSFYMESPSGFQIEYGHGGIEIDDAEWDVAVYQAASIWGHRSPVAAY